MDFRQLKQLADSLPHLSGTDIKTILGPYLGYEARQLRGLRATVDEMTIIQAVIQMKKKGVLPELEGLYSSGRGSENYNKVYGALWQAPVFRPKDDEEENDG